MGVSCAVRTAALTAALIAVAVRADASTTHLLTDGTADTVDGHFHVPVDEYGSYGRLFPMSVFDWFKPPGTAADYPTYLAGAFLFVTTGGTKTSSFVLSEYDLWAGFLEAPPQEDGIVGMHANLARTITTAISGTTTQATSAFELTSDDFKIHVDLTQSIVPNAAQATSLLKQVYRIQNQSAIPVDLVFHAAWEPDLYYNNGVTNGYANDVVGTVPGRCAVYVHNPMSTTQAVALTAGSGTTVTAAPFMYGGKQGQTPGAGPAFEPLSAADNLQHIWINHGMPLAWRDFVVGPGYTGDGDSGTLIADATIGMEWHFTVAANSEETIDVRRIYGTIAVPCNVPVTCGNSMIDPGEMCDGTDTATCVGATCLPSTCGDGYPNPAVPEECDSSLVDTEDCNGALCTTPRCGDGYLNLAANEMCDDAEETASCTAMCQPSSCGDGYVNKAADEECDGDELCDPVTCKVMFTVGGGCAGCGTRDASPGTLALVLALLGFSSRSRRRARTARTRMRGPTL